MSRNLNVALLCSNDIGRYQSLEKILHAIERIDHTVELLEVGNITTERFAFWRDYDDQTRKELGIAYQKQELSFWVSGRQPGSINLPVKVRWRTEKGNSCSGNMTAETSDTAMFTQKRWNPEDNAQKLLLLVKALYHASQPKFAWIERCHSRGYTTQKDIENLHLPHIYWANFFGPEYVEKLDRKFLVNAPGWKIEELEDGGILYVLTPSLVGTGPKRILQDVQAYFCVESVRRRAKGRGRK